MTTDLDQLLGSYSESDYSVRLINGLCAVVPFAESPGTWFTVSDGLKQAHPEAKKAELVRVLALSNEPGPQRALWIFDAIDKADSGIGVVSGVASAYKLYQAKDGDERIDALETDSQQAVDAVLKALAIAYAIHRLYTGSVTEKIAQFRASDSGKAMLFYLAAVEVGLPFTDNVLQGGASVMGDLIAKYGPDQQAKLAALTSDAEAEEAMGVLTKLTDSLGTMVEMAGQHLSPIAATVSEYLPKAMNVGDKAAGVAATGADLLPIYRYLGARLVADECIRRAGEPSSTSSASGDDAPHAADVPIQYTRSADDLPAAPPKKKGCFGLFVVLLTLGAGGLLGSLTWASVALGVL